MRSITWLMAAMALLFGVPGSVLGGQTLDDLKTASEIAGKPGALTKGGEIAAMDDKIPFLLWTKAGGAKTLSALAGDLCKELKAAARSGPLLLAPADYSAQYALATAYDIQLRELEEHGREMVRRLDLAPKEPPADGQSGGQKAQVALLPALFAAEFLVGAVSNLIKSASPDRSLAALREDRAALFRVLARNNQDCFGVITVPDPAAESRPALEARLTELYRRVAGLRTVYEQWAGAKAAAQAAVEDESKAKVVNGSAAARLKAVMAFAGLGAALKEFVAASGLDALAGVAAAMELKQNTAGKPVLLTTLEAEELQIQKDGALSKRLCRSATATLEYRMLGGDGSLGASGYIARSSAEEEKDWGKPWTASFRP